MSPVRVPLKRLRKEAGLTQYALAKKAGVRRATISELEKRTSSRVSLDVIDRLADALGVEPGALLESTRRRTK